MDINALMMLPVVMGSCVVVCHYPKTVVFGALVLFLLPKYVPLFM